MGSGNLLGFLSLVTLSTAQMTKRDAGLGREFQHSLEVKLEGCWKSLRVPYVVLLLQADCVAINGFLICALVVDGRSWLHLRGSATPH